MRKNTMRVCAEIDLDAICHNIEAVQQKAGADKKVLAVLKANGYGHGAAVIAQALVRRTGIYGFAVATAAEGVELRRSGIQNPILILGYSFPEQYGTILQYDLIQTVFQLESAKALSDLALACGKKAVVHIKIDTGMGRIGFRPAQESIEQIRRIAELPGVTVEGIFTHFACADEADTAFADLQERRFADFLRALEQAGVTVPIRHAANSAAIIAFEDRYWDLVRSGIMTYGLYPSAEVEHSKVMLRPALSLKSHVAFVKTIYPGESISYGATYTAKEERTIATIPVGYADGYPRALSGKGQVLIAGCRAPIVGRVCMDQFMVDVTELPGVQQGDPVTLIGVMGAEQITVEELAKQAGTFNYELVCNINQRVPRVYLEQGQVTQIIDYLDEAQLGRGL